MNRQAEQHLAKAKDYLAKGEDFYRKAAEEISAAFTADPTLTQAQVGERFGKGQSWVSELLAWRKGNLARDTPFARGDWESRKRQLERHVVPTHHEDRVEMATQLLADPKVVQDVLDTPTQARSELLIAVHRENIERRDAAIAREQQRRKDEARPLPAYMAKMVVKMNEWAIGLQALTDEDLDGLPEGRQLELVANAAGYLEAQARRIRERCDRPVLRMIEGQARNVTKSA
jgi:hypothetical protein